MALANQRGLVLKRGRPVAADSRRQQLLASRLRNKEAKLAAATSTQSCTWVTSTRGGLQTSRRSDACCKERVCNQTFDERAPATTSGADIIGNLRRYYINLDKEGKRAFLAERVETRDQLLLLNHDDLRRKHVFDLYLETPEVLARGLAQVDLGSILRLPKPRHADSVLVCSEFFFFALGAHKDTLYQDKMRRNHGPVTVPAVLSPSEPREVPQRRERLPNPDVLNKRDLVAHFIKNEGRVGIRLPNLTKIVLPYRSVMSTHAAYVRREETRLEAAAAQVATDHAGSTEDELQVLADTFKCGACKVAFNKVRVRGAENINQVVPVASVLVSKLESRYLNRLCGPRGDPPAESHAEICVLPYFVYCWTTDQTLKQYGFHLRSARFANSSSWRS